MTFGPNDGYAICTRCQTRTRPTDTKGRVNGPCWRCNYGAASRGSAKTEGEKVNMSLKKAGFDVPALPFDATPKKRRRGNGKGFVTQPGSTTATLSKHRITTSDGVLVGWSAKPWINFLMPGEYLIDRSPLIVSEMDRYELIGKPQRSSKKKSNASA